VYEGAVKTLSLGKQEDPMKRSWLNESPKTPEQIAHATKLERARVVWNTFSPIQKELFVVYDSAVPSSGDYLLLLHQMEKAAQEEERKKSKT